MGSMIQLSVGRLEVDWGKNFGFTDYSAFYQPSDACDVPYYYVVDGSDYVDAENSDRVQGWTFEASEPR